MRPPQESVLYVGSLFSGAGLGDIAAEAVGLSHVWFCECDPFARAVLERRWPDVPVFHDVRDVHAKSAKRVDIVIGGFPCQDISVGGKGAGITGKRSGLWSQYARIIRELRPRYAVVENVKALLGRGLDRVLGDLAEIGYDAEWDVFPAAAFGAPHLRERVILVAYPEALEGERVRQYCRRLETWQSTGNLTARLIGMAYGLKDREPRPPFRLIAAPSFVEWMK